ncbi:hypothetical protein GCM10009772_38490 [Pseudonocardia alni subsp. carboxydivorans]
MTSSWRAGAYMGSSGARERLEDDCAARCGQVRSSTAEERVRIRYRAAPIHDSHAGIASRARRS